MHQVSSPQATPAPVTDDQVGDTSYVSDQPPAAEEPSTFEDQQASPPSPPPPPPAIPTHHAQPNKASKWTLRSRKDKITVFIIFYRECMDLEIIC